MSGWEKRTGVCGEEIQVPVRRNLFFDCQAKARDEVISNHGKAHHMRPTGKEGGRGRGWKTKNLLRRKLLPSLVCVCVWEK